MTDPTNKDIAELLGKLIAPVEEALTEVRRSTHSRYLILLVQGLLSVVVVWVCLRAVDDLERIAKHMEAVVDVQTQEQVQHSLTSAQVGDLYELIERHTNKPDVLTEIRSLRKAHSNPSVEEIRDAVIQAREPLYKALVGKEPPGEGEHIEVGASAPVIDEEVSKDAGEDGE